MNTEYHKIQSIFKRDLSTPRKTMIDGDWTLPEFEYLANNKWSFTEKVDGTNIRVHVSPSGLAGFGGRTENANIPAPLVGRLNDRFLSCPDKLRSVFDNGAVMYGEGYGAKIQKIGGNYRQDQDFVLFDVRVGEWWLSRDDVVDVAIRLGLDFVPIIGYGSLLDAVDLVKGGLKSTWGNFDAEGIVARPVVEMRRRNGDRIIAKIKGRDFSSQSSDKAAA